MTSRSRLALLAVAVLTAAGCRNVGIGPFGQTVADRRIGNAVQFDDAVVVSVSVRDTDAAGAVEALLGQLDAAADIDASGRLSTGRVVVAVDFTGGTWLVDFHLVWPYLGGAQDGTREFKFVNWTVIGMPGRTSKTAREAAEVRLRKAIAAAVADGGPLAGRLVLIGGTPEAP